jgi:hypothetical protein
MGRSVSARGRSGGNPYADDPLYLYLTRVREQAYRASRKRIDSLRRHRRRAMDPDYRDKERMFSVCLLKGPKRTAKRKTAKKKAAGKKGKNGKAGKAVRAERAAMTLETMSVRAGFADTTPRRENIPGIAADFPDIGDWREAAGSDSLRIRPFFTGSGSRPFSCLRATQIRIEPPRKKKWRGLSRSQRLLPGAGMSLIHLIASSN